MITRLILCCGNPERGDDCAGALVARRLRELGVEAQEHSGEATSLIEAWRGAEEVILVDAVFTGKRRGTVTYWDACTESIAAPPLLSSSHSLGLAEAIALARLLGTLPPHVSLYGIEARQFEFGARPSTAVLAAVERVARRIHEHCIDQRRPAV